VVCECWPPAVFENKVAVIHSTPAFALVETIVLHPGENLERPYPRHEGVLRCGSDDLHSDRSERLACTLLEVRSTTPICGEDDHGVGLFANTFDL